MRTLQELVSTDEPCWDDIQQMLKEASNKVVVLPRSKKHAEEVVVQLQLDIQTWLGAVAYETGGILIDNGWIRVIGSGSEQMKRSLSSWNIGKAFDSYDEEYPFLLVADDALGGFYAVNFGEFGNDVGSIYYFAPDSLEWEPMDMEYGQLLWFFFSGDLAGFYEGFRWKGWMGEVLKLGADEAYHVFPALYSDELSSMDKTERTAVSVEEIYELEMENAEAFDENSEE